MNLRSPLETEGLIDRGERERNETIYLDLGLKQIVVPIFTRIGADLGSAQAFCLEQMTFNIHIKLFAT